MTAGVEFTGKWRWAQAYAYESRSDSDWRANIPTIAGDRTFSIWVETTGHANRRRITG